MARLLMPLMLKCFIMPQSVTIWVDLKGSKNALLSSLLWLAFSGELLLRVFLGHTEEHTEKKYKKTKMEIKIQ